MIFNIPVGGKRTVAVSVYGAPFEDVLLVHTNGTEYTATTNKHGDGGTLDLPFGSYTISGDVSGFSGPVTVAKDTTFVAAYPDGAIFWYGNGAVADDTLWSKCGGWSIAHGSYPSGHVRKGAKWADYHEGAYGIDSNDDGTIEAWYSWAENTGSSTQRGVTSYIKKSISYAGYTKIKTFCNSSVSDYGKSVVGTCASTPKDGGSSDTGVAWTPQVSVSVGDATAKTVSMTLTGSSGYFCASAFGANNDSAGNISSASNKIYAVWLE